MTTLCATGLLLDERCDPPLRTVIGSLLSRCTRASIALSNVRLAMLDLDDAELTGVRHCRILLGRLDARALGAAAHDATTLRHAATLLDFIASERVELRSAGLTTWTPDFSIYSRERAALASREAASQPERSALIGAHWFRDPTAAGGPSFTVCTNDPHMVGLAIARFEEMWRTGYDIRAAVLDTVRAWSAGG